MNKFNSYKSKPVVSQLLPAGEHRVKLISIMETDSFTSHDKTVKDNLPEWSNPTDQLLIHVVSIDNKGSLIHRLQGQGWLKFADLTDNEVKSKKFTNIDGYACAKVDGKIMRIEDPAKTATCDRILDRFMNAVGAPEGSDLDYLNTAIARGTEFNVIVVNDEYEGKDQLRIKAFKPVQAEVLVKDDLEK